MTNLDERARHELYRAAEQLLGPAQANTLMTLLPPVGWADVATKDDLRQLEARIETRVDARFGRLEARIGDLETRMDGRFVQVDLRFAELEARFDARLERGLREQTRTLMLGLVGAMATMTSLCLGAVALTA